MPVEHSTTGRVRSADEFLDEIPAAEYGTPVWWLADLLAEMDRRASVIELYDDYFEGRHKMTFASSQFREAFAALLSSVSDNWIPLVIGASVERLEPQGFLFGGEQKGDDEAWRIWQENYLDADSSLAFTEACKHGESALLIWPEPGHRSTGTFGRFFSRRSGAAVPRITVEHPGQMVVRRAAGDRRRIAAALKRWQEDDGTIRATLYLPDAFHRFAKSEKTGKWTTISSEPNPLGVVPVVPVVNDPQMIGARPPASLLALPHSVDNTPIGLGRSDMADIVSTVDQINKLICDMLIASEVAAFRQRWMTGVELPVDPDTGEHVQTFKAAIDRLWVIGPDEDGENNARIGEFAATDLANYYKAIETRIQSLAARTRTPPHYLLGSIVNASGDALKAAETGLASKVRGKARSFGEAIEEAVRIAFAWMGDAARATDRSAQTIWGPMESRSESEYVDSLVKKMAMGVPKEQLWADAGYSPQQIGRFKAMLFEQAALSDLFAPEQPISPAESPPEAPVT